MDFSKIENILEQALRENEDKTSSLEKLQDEYNELIKMLDMFSKKLSHEVLVPVTTKAFMPGVIYHTNEIFVSHGADFFSECSVSKTREIIKIRLKRITEELTKLVKEKDMFQSKLEVPYAEGVLPNESQQEIIEEYDEEKEKQWRLDHKQRLLEYKNVERQLRENKSEEKSHEDVMEMLDKLELLEELDQELEYLQVDNDSTLDKIISGEISLPKEKKRNSYENSQTKNINTHAESLEEPDSMELSQKKPESMPVNSDLFLKRDFSEENIDLMKEIIHNYPSKNKMQYLTSILNEVDDDLQKCQVFTSDDLDRKLSLVDLKDYIQDEIELSKLQTINDHHEMSNSTKKKISFALEDEVRFISKSEQDNILESKLYQQSSSVQDVCFTNKEKVENYDLVSKILNEASKNYETLRIEFKHSENVSHSKSHKTDKNEDNIICSPSDIYEMYSKDNTESDYNNSCDSINILLENLKQNTTTSLEDKQESLVNHNQQPVLKSILKNKTSIKTKEDKENQTIRNVGDNTSNLVGDVVENLSNTSKLSSEENYIDTSDSKRRASRFKKMRENVNKRKL